MAEPKKHQVTTVAVKPQYVAVGDETTTATTTTEGTRDGDGQDDGEIPDKKAKLESGADPVSSGRQKNKGKKFYKNSRYRGRERNSIYESLCKTLIDVPVNGAMPVCESLRCRYLHDVNKFLQSKPPDIGEECHVFNVRGHCPRGISCRFGSRHITESGRNVVDEAVRDRYERLGPKTLTFYTKDLENELRKRTYDFSKAEQVLEVLPRVKMPPPPPLPPLPHHPGPPFGPFVNSPIWNQGEIDFTEDIDVVQTPPTPPPPPSGTPDGLIPPLMEEPVGPCPDDDLFKLHLAERKKIDWTDRLYLAPLTNFGNLPFRRICKEFGADVTCSEMVVATSILQSQPFEWLLTKRHETEDMFGIQLYGSNPFAVTRCVQLLEEKTNVDFIDINVGSPGDMVPRPRAGSLVRREKVVETIVRCVTRVSCLPVTVTTRLGDYRDEKLANKYLPNYRACQVSLVTVQGRHRDTKQVDWNYVNDLAGNLSPVKVYGLSDVLSSRDYLEIKENYSNLSGALIGRGALVKPWLFDEVKHRRDWDISSSERFDVLRRFVNYGLEHWGSDTKGVELTRRFLLDWLSFLCRYVPVGLLERPPQRLNEKIPKFVGRDDMETLLGSQRPEDWVKISEMLLGPYPENGQFVPRIKPGFWPIDS